MQLTTDLSALRQIAEKYLDSPIVPYSASPSAIRHPVVDSAIQFVEQAGKIITENILENESAKAWIMQRYLDRIRNAQTAAEIFLLIRKPYRFPFFGDVADLMSEDDYGAILSILWETRDENDQSITVANDQIAAWFRQAPKQTLMNEEDLAVWSSLPEEMTVYRAVAVDRDKKGLAWTRDSEFAVRLAHDRDRDGLSGYVLAGEVRREDVLAYLNRRHEDEYVIAYSSVKNVRVFEGVEQPEQ